MDRIESCAIEAARGGDVVRAGRIGVLAPLERAVEWAASPIDVRRARGLTRTATHRASARAASADDFLGGSDQVAVLGPRPRDRDRPAAGLGMSSSSPVLDPRIRDR